MQDNYIVSCVGMDNRKIDLFGVILDIAFTSLSQRKAGQIF